MGHSAKNNVTTHTRTRTHTHTHARIANSFVISLFRLIQFPASQINTQTHTHFDEQVSIAYLDEYADFKHQLLYIRL